MDLAELFSENPLSPRYVLSLLLDLPADSAFMASRRGGRQFRGWDARTYALATLVNEQRSGNHIQLLVNSDPKKSKPKPPEPFPVPNGSTKSQAPKPGSFAAMIVAAKKAAQENKEALNG